jgi:hypothetical protein
MEGFVIIELSLNGFEVFINSILNNFVHYGLLFLHDLWLGYKFDCLIPAQDCLVIAHLLDV